MSIPGLFEDEMLCPRCGQVAERCDRPSCPMVPAPSEWERTKANARQAAAEKWALARDTLAALWRRIT